MPLRDFRWTIRYWRNEEATSTPAGTAADDERS